MWTSRSTFTRTREYLFAFAPIQCAAAQDPIYSSTSRGKGGSYDRRDDHIATPRRSLSAQACLAEAWNRIIFPTGGSAKQKDRSETRWNFYRGVPSTPYEDSDERTNFGSRMPRNRKKGPVAGPKRSVVTDPTTKNNDSAVNHSSSTGKLLSIEDSTHLCSKAIKPWPLCPDRTLISRVRLHAERMHRNGKSLHSALTIEWVSYS